LNPSLNSTQNSTLQQQTTDHNKIELTENQKKLLGMTSLDDPSASLEQQVDITLKGKDQRIILMQKLMQRKLESKIIVLRNMVDANDVDSELESEITGFIKLIKKNLSLKQNFKFFKII
jgi:hypothetical protein